MRAMVGLLVVGALGLAGCKPTPTDSGTVPASGTETLPGSPSTGSTGPTGDTGPVAEPFDCATIPTLPEEPLTLEGPTGYHDLAFSPDGFILGNSRFNQHLVKDDGAGFQENLVEGIGQIQGMEWLPDGRLAVASDGTGAIYVVNAAGGRSILTPGVWAYGLIMGPDGKLWSANNNIVQRHDLQTGGSEVMVSSLPAGGARVINFSPDKRWLYIGTNFGNGAIYRVELDANADPLGGPEVLAEDVGDGAYQDGLGVDVCGYLYVPDYGTTALYRVSPDGLVQTFYDSGLSQYGHGVEWGSGLGPWRTDAIYLPLPYGQNKVIELGIGVPRTWDGPILNAP